MTRPLEHAHVAAVAFAFGAASRLAPAKRPPGLLSTLAHELDARGVLPAVVDTLSPALRDALLLSVTFDATRARQRRRA